MGGTGGLAEVVRTMGRAMVVAMGMVAMALAVGAAPRPAAAQTTGAGAAHPAEAAASVAASHGMAQPLPGTAPGDAARGRAIVASRQLGLCLLCHRAPIDSERQQGNLASDLAGAGSRWSAAQLRARIVDAKQLNPTSLMPAYHRTEGLTRVGAAWRGKPVFDAQQVEDVVAYLVTLQ